MKITSKLFMLGLMLLGIAGVNCKESPHDVKAAEPGSYATLKEGQLRLAWGYGSSYSDKVVKVTITNDENKVEGTNYVTQIEVGAEISDYNKYNNNGFLVSAYIYIKMLKIQHYMIVSYTLK